MKRALSLWQERVQRADQLDELKLVDEVEFVLRDEQAQEVYTVKVDSYSIQVKDHDQRETEAGVEIIGDRESLLELINGESWLSKQRRTKEVTVTGALRQQLKVEALLYIPAS
ncbi:SCP2 sterol-binding domain-containing protein [Texcoconibacillus texcoconensis]|uniref:DNA polymerase III sliding clamp (Beta) subunit (PCNA family) n=1 Tax=Texcoconibacillus texcoconensis TaxID=1095777 RepID=A0A840QQ10_9BACI|nr:DNA polymerase III sliding clamp (beta) subunit (PCNA family) [Texcoconibacillus texcoconensis]